uniref:hypothetical protein n=1 Tax=Falsiroseomonas oryzae TaxID=2766473 RepID=UPI0022EB939F
MNAARRTLLACLPAALAPAAARAFRPEAATGAAAAEPGDAACAETAVHDAIRMELERLVDGRPVPPPLTALARCPFCGCS